MASDAAAPAAPSPTSPAVPTSIYLVSHPKVIFLYPSFLMSILCGIVVALQKGEVDNNDTVVFMTSSFLGVLAINLVVFSFEFPRMTSFTLVLGVLVLVLAGWLTFQYYPWIFPIIGDFLKKIRPVANATFFFAFAAILLVIYIAVFISIQFDYWEVRPNELLHHHGFLSDMERYPAPSLRISKEIGDVFEFLLLRSGRLILHPSSEPRAIVLENVLFINRKEELLTKMLSALQVQVRREPTDGPI